MAVWPPPAPPRDLTPRPTITAGRVITKKISEYNYTRHGETLPGLVRQRDTGERNEAGVMKAVKNASGHNELVVSPLEILRYFDVFVVF